MKKLRFSVKSQKTNKKSLDKKVAPDVGITKKTNFKIKAFTFPFSVDIAQPKKYSSIFKEIKWLQRATNKDFTSNGSFQEAVGPVLAMAQCFSVMPVVGIQSGSAAKMHFTWKSFRAMYSLITTVLVVIYAGMTIYTGFFNEKVEFDLIVPVIFYASIVYGLIVFGCMAPKWPKLMQHWESVELELPKFRTQKEKGQLRYQIKMIAIIIMTLSLGTLANAGISTKIMDKCGSIYSAIVEHILNIISIVHFANKCLHLKDPIKSFFMAQLSQLFSFTTYAPWKAFIGKVLNVIATFMWNYMDLFVMLVSVGLSSRFKQINSDLTRIKGEHMSEDFWAQRRQQYRKLCVLCGEVDNTISKITIVSFSNNLFFICVQLLRSLKPMPSFAHAIYFWFSLIFLISRTLAVSLFSSQIHDESKKPIEVLRAVPPNSWCLEVRRFSEEVINDTIALSGMKFFFLTRKLILSVAGTIATYELVLIQFNTENSSNPASDEC